ncbi:MAG: glycerol-3-phosphate dehydrogenase/oxidase, partial [Acidimicrobiales bacterium]
QLRADRLVASFVYWDAQADDARLTLAVARTAAVHGAVVATRSPVVALLRRADGRIGGVRLADGTQVRSRAVVNAAGVWAEKVAELPGGPAAQGVPRLRPAKGVHIAVPSERLACSWATVLSVPGGGRTIFVAPWDAQGAETPSAPGRFTYVGTTDDDYDGPLDGPLDTPRHGGQDVEGLLATVNHWTTAGLTTDDVTGAWVGLRPLVAGDHHLRSADLSRRHRVLQSPDGLVTVTGGKLTTYRRMAEETVDAVLRQPGSRRPARACRTRHLPLVGAPGWDRVPQGGPLLGRGDVHHQLVGRYGAEAGAIVGMCSADPSLAQPLVPGLPYLRAEAVWAARREMAVTLEDVLARRTRALMLDEAATVAAAADVARLLAPELGWDDSRVAAEVDSLRAGAASGAPAGAGVDT